MEPIDGGIKTSGRIVCQFSCGAASAVATKLAIAEYASTHDVVVVNAFVKEEHADNRRFLADCEKWFGQSVVVLCDEKYGASTLEVFRRTQYIKGPYGASCTSRLKRRVLDEWSKPGDIMVFGYTAEETERLERFQDRHPERPVIAPLIARGLTKSDCKAMVERAGIELPYMYKLGYHNANCVGCVKGGAGYFRAIRHDFPDAFEQLARIEASLGESAYLLVHRSGPHKGERFPLRELGNGPVTRNERFPSCSFFCVNAEREYLDNLEVQND